ncbi:membrane protein [Porphyromonas macacae]|uniref:Diadenylate cyclase n=1 Tax=Porphyromonas macacae TaxID=28115 RepID=A0A0A2G8L7_9PORP|nr:diadenylate cyclase [Porphyromonas macacae]KGN72469.1 membrane protein [Porphyromonas macacae]KGN99623.1 membrane protein [Porphyromonas macacae]SUB78618.1 DNA integrity scanning protein DisA [Porphyromonas macacae]SUB89809.1 DNA integrity scanning protein DisA [Porphyromonas macacae]
MWLPFTIKDALDIFFVAIFMFYVYNMLKNSGSRALFMGIIAFIVLWILISQVFQMRLMGAILNKFVSVGVLVLVIIFQEEIRRFLSSIGSANGIKFLRNIFMEHKKGSEKEGTKYVAPVVLASMNLARKKTGALIAIQQMMDLSAYEYTGEMFRSDINARLIENIFFKNSPLHDGAMIISHNQIRAAGCILPVANNEDLSKDLGLRHRSALGLAQETDAKVIIISEERGTISLAHRGEIHVDIGPEELQQRLLSE